mmetsp:Transcript_62438/g.115942  ORF Transcript_62438/g.115942 Transcript_62438/m.115942 type:complete len:498 (+) Transcript_62438:84-1577(+)
MGGANSLPRRVNIVYGGRFALVIRESGDCPASAISAQQVLGEKQLRSSKRCKWKIQLDENDDGSDMTGSWRVRIRTDALPHRVLKSGDKVMFEEGRNPRMNEHLWQVHFEEQEASRGDGVAPPFTITSLSKGHYGMYLAIDEATSKVVLTSTKPAQTWTFHDAGASTKSVQAGAPKASGGMMRRGDSTGRFTHVSERSTKSAKGTSVSSFQSRAESDILEVFNGSAEDAVHAVTQIGNPSTVKRFSTLSDMHKGYSLGADEEVATSAMGATARGIYSVLFGPDSVFRERLADGVNPWLGPIEKVDGAPWCARARMNQTIPAAMFGQCPLEENIRIVMCKQEGRPSLMVHVQSCLTLPMKSFVTEHLHTFSQKEDGSVSIHSVGKAQPGFGHSKAVEGMKERRVIFCALVKELLTAAPCQQLCLPEEDLSPGRDELRSSTPPVSAKSLKQASAAHAVAGRPTEPAKLLLKDQAKEPLPCCAAGLMVLFNQLQALLLKK